MVLSAYAGHLFQWRARVGFMDRAADLCCRMVGRARMVWARSVVVDLTQVGRHRGVVWIMWSPARAGGFHRCLRLRWRLPRIEHIEPAGAVARWVPRIDAAAWTGREYHTAVAPGWFEASLRVNDDLYDWRIGHER